MKCNSYLYLVISCGNWHTQDAFGPVPGEFVDVGVEPRILDEYSNQHAFSKEFEATIANSLSGANKHKKTIHVYKQ